MSNISNEKYVEKLAAMYSQIMDLRKDDDYVVNQPQMDHLMKIVEFFIDAANEQGGKVQPLKLIPREERGGVTASFVVFDIFGEQVLRFCDVMRNASAISIDGGEDCIYISCTVPNVFIHK